jgi:hypothetical protein
MPQNMMVPRRRALVAPLSLVLALALGGVAHAASPTPKITGVKPLKIEIGGTLTVTGKYFTPGKSKNIVVFKRDGKPAVFVKVTNQATSSKLTVMVPAKLMPFLANGDKTGIYRFRLRVLAKRFGDAFTATKLSPQIGAPGALGGAGTPSAPEADCDNDKSPNNVDTDDDNDGLPDTAEAGLKTDPCKIDSDGDSVSDTFEVESALDLNLRAVPYPGKRPYPNALDGSDAARDFDGDGMAMIEEYTMWLYTNGGRLPLTYSDGDQDTNPDGATTDSPGSPLDMNHNGQLSDDEKDADGDGLTNFDESHGRLTPDYFAKAIQKEQAFYGRADVQAMTAVNYVDPDVDGDGVLDGADDQDHDGWSNIDEVSRSALPAAAHPAYAGVTGLAGLYIAVNPYNPCLPDPNSRVCSLHPPIDPTSSWAPFDGSVDTGHPPYALSANTGHS